MMTFEDYNNKMDEINREIMKFRKDEGDIVCRLEEMRQQKLRELKQERDIYLNNWNIKVSDINAGTTKAIQQTRNESRYTRCKLDNQRRIVCYEYNENDGNTEEII